MDYVKEIKKHCLGCANGLLRHSRVLCRHWTHPGYVGGCGTEWALHCTHYDPSKPAEKEIVQCAPTTVEERERAIESDLT